MTDNTRDIGEEIGSEETPLAMTGPNDTEGHRGTSRAGDYPIPDCRLCHNFRINDFHYFYCREFGNKTKPDNDAYNGGLARIWNYPNRIDGCDVDVPRKSST